MSDKVIVMLVTLSMASHYGLKVGPQSCCMKQNKKIGHDTCSSIKIAWLIYHGIVRIFI